MAVTAANVLVGKPVATGGILVAPLSTALPTSTATAPNVAFVAVGYVGEGGVTQTVAADQTDIKAWGGDIVRTIQTSHKATFEFTLIETNADSLGVYYGSTNVTGTTSLTAKIVAGDLPHQEWIIDILDGAKKVRIVLPDANVTDRGAVEYHSDSAIGYPVTLTAYPDGTGTKAYIYSA